MFNQSGQAFDVFKLLIAAVVAVVILTLLLSIINTIGVFGQSDPASKAGTLIRDLSSKKATYSISDSVSFSNGIGLNSKAIAATASLQAEDVCVLPGDFSESFGSVGDSGKTWVGTLGVTVSYKGSSPQKARIGAICDIGKDMSDDTSYFETFTNGEIDSSQISDCPCINSSNQTTCCVVAIKR